MQISITIKKSVAITRVWLSILKNNIYVSVSDIALFLNVLFGTFTITGQKINEMLEDTGYQLTKTEKELQRDDLIDIKYLYLSKANGFAKIDTIIRDGTEINRLVWNARVLLDIFDVDLEDEELKVMDSFCNGVYEHNLINTKKDEINYSILEDNISYLKEECNRERN